MKPKFFATPIEFRRWLEQNHQTASELWMGFYKKATGVEGRMRPAGAKAFETRDASKAERYSYEQRKTMTLTPAMERRFRENATAW